MKTTVNVNISGFLFHLDKDAYDILKKYLDKISFSISNKSEAEEIIHDIESRIAELFKEKLGKTRQVINVFDVEQVISVIGEPEEIGGSAKENKEYNYTKSYKESTKKMYRDPDNKIIAGVCGGLGVYFNLDPVLIRVIFILIVFGAGFGLLIYIILWIILPVAYTQEQKREMRGEFVN